MQNHLSAVDLGYRLPDGSALFTSLTFSFGMVRTGLTGQNGVGKSTLLEILAGKKFPAQGSLTRAGRVSYLPQEAAAAPGATIADVLGFAAELAALDRIGRGDGGLDDFELVEGCWDLAERIEKTFAEVAISQLAPGRSVSTLSGGELMRVRWAGLLLREPDFLLLDEPTNHLDFAGREFIYGLIAAWKKGMVVVSHDRALLALVDQIAEFNARGLKFYGGNFEFYRQQREAERAAAEQSLAGARQRLKKAEVLARAAIERQERRQAAGRRKVAKLNIAPIAAGNLQRHAEKTAAKVADRHDKKVEGARNEVQLPIRLYTFQCNEAARHFYEHHGFRAIAYSDGSGNEEKCPDILYEWQPESLQSEFITDKL